MAPQEPLKILGLKPTATPEEIRQAYRDLVKVWHPDRFGTDARLRAKAEEQLKAINAAFNTLEASDFKTEPSSARRPAAVPDPAMPSHRASSRERVARGWLYVGSMVLMAGITGFVVHAVGANQVPSSTPAVQPPASADQRHAPKPSRRTQLRQSQATPAGTPDFKVWSLSQADTDRLQLACAAHNSGTEPYRECIAAQLHAVTQPRGTPNMTGMSTGERDAAESACRTAKIGGEATYNRCLRQQVAALAAEPIRPDLSTFSATDRDSVRTACSAASRRGAAEYDRCLARFARTLSDAQPSPQAR